MKQTRIERYRVKVKAQTKRKRRMVQLVAITGLVCPTILGGIYVLADAIPPVEESQQIVETQTTGEEILEEAAEVTLSTGEEFIPEDIVEEDEVNSDYENAESSLVTYTMYGFDSQTGTKLYEEQLTGQIGDRVTPRYVEGYNTPSEEAILSSDGQFFEYGYYAITVEELKTPAEWGLDVDSVERLIEKVFDAMNNPQRYTKESYELFMNEPDDSGFYVEEFANVARSNWEYQMALEEAQWLVDWATTGLTSAYNKLVLSSDEEATTLNFDSLTTTLKKAIYALENPELYVQDNEYNVFQGQATGANSGLQNNNVWGLLHHIENGTTESVVNRDGEQWLATQEQVDRLNLYISNLMSGLTLADEENDLVIYTVIGYDEDGNELYKEEYVGRILDEVIGREVDGYSKVSVNSVTVYEEKQIIEFFYFSGKTTAEKLSEYLQKHYSLNPEDYTSQSWSDYMAFLGWDPNYSLSIIQSSEEIVNGTFEYLEFPAVVGGYIGLWERANALLVRKDSLDEDIPSEKEPLDYSSLEELLEKLNPDNWTDESWTSFMNSRARRIYETLLAYIEERDQGENTYRVQGHIDTIVAYGTDILDMLVPADDTNTEDGSENEEPNEEDNSSTDDNNEDDTTDDDTTSGGTDKEDGTTGNTTDDVTDDQVADDTAKEENEQETNKEDEKEAPKTESTSKTKDSTKELPKTGEKNSLVLSLSGLAVLSLGLVGMVIKRFKRV